MFTRLLCTAAWATIASVWATSAQAQTPPAEQQGLQPSTVNQELTDTAQPGNAESGLADIVVTATRRDTDLQETPLAVSAIDESLIEQASPRDIGDLSVFVPNFSAATITGFNAASFAIRGVGQNSIIVYFEPPVAVLVDDFVVPSVQTQLLDTFDVAQVEVLRGPQGTLFGKNTTGGVVTVRTKRPDLDNFGAEARGMVGSFGTRQAQGAVNAVLIPGQLGLRLVAGYESSNGYYKNGACYGPVVAFVPSKFAGVKGCGNGESLGGVDVLNMRAKLLWEPSTRFSALLQYEYLRDSSDSIPTVSETPDSPAFLFDILGVGASNPASKDPLDNAGISNRQSALIFMRQGQRINVDGVYLNMDLDVGLGTITSISGYRFQRSRLPNTYTGQAPVAPDGDVLSLFDASRDDDRKTYQQEVRFASDLEGPFDFVAGAFYQRDTVDFCVTQILGFLDLAQGPLPFGAWNDTPFILCNAQKARSTAVFAEGTFNFNDRLSLTVGGRYTWERKTWRGRQQVFIPQLNGGFDPTIRIDETLDASVNNFPAGVITVRDKANEPTYRASLSYKATDDLFFYGTYSHGFKAGGFNDQIGGFAPFGTDLDAFAEAAQATRPETADSFEAGVKSELFDRRLRLNVTGFYVKYQDLQKQIVVPIVVNGQPNQVTRFFNAASAEVKGIEAEATAALFEGFTLRGVLGYQDAQYNEYVTPIPAGYDLASAPLDRAPKWQWTVDATYQLPIGSAHVVTFNGQANYTSRNLFSQSITSPDENTFLDARTLLNASVTFAEVDGAYYVRGMVRNITDERYRTASQVVGGLWANSQFGPPRFYGVELGVKFGGR